MDVMRKARVAALATVAMALPSGVLADPPAAVAPLPPPVFAGAPTTQGPQGGSFTVNFDGLGRFEGVGRADEHAQPFNNLSSEEARRQARVTSSAAQNAATDHVFLSFLSQLRTVDAAPTNRRSH